MEDLSVLLVEFAQSLEHTVRLAKRRDLASQVHDLRIYGRCDCGRT
jgi:hypothetical protein